MTLDMDIWQMRDCQQCDLGVKPKMMDFDNKRHDKKLFDTTCHEKEKEFLRKGQLYDCSKARGHLIEIKKSKFPFIGHKIEMHHVMTALTDQKSVKHLCHIKGKRGTGKTRFMKEVAYYLYQRGKFSFKIQY